MEVSNRIKGVFFGQAIGDALGLATEFMSKEEVKEHYPNGVPHYQDIVQDKHRSRWTAGDWTDDTEQWLCILNSILEHGEIRPLDIASRMHSWMINGGMGIGISTYRVMSLPQYTEFPYKGSELVWKMKGKNLAPNGALMRNSIVCLYQYQDLNLVLDHCDKIARLTHHDPRCVDCCKVMAHLIHGELTGSPVAFDSLKSLFSTYDSRIAEYILPLSADITQLSLDEHQSVGYTLKALAAGLWAYYHAEDFEDGIHQIVMEGGDADTNGCIAGSLLGAKYGFEMIPGYLVNGLLQKDELLSYLDDFRAIG